MRLGSSASHRLPAALLMLVAMFAGTAALGAYADWQWWMPYQGVTITIAVVALLLLALVLGTAPRARTLALALAVSGGGLLAGQHLGPARPELRHSEGRISVALTSPVASSGEHRATCASHVESGELQVSGDSNLRIEILPDRADTPADVDQREMLGFSVSVGDRWDQGPRPRADHIFVSIFVSSVHEDSGYTILWSGPDSRLDLGWTEVGGTLSFSGLHAAEPTADSDVLTEIAGTAEWTCG